MCQTNVFFISFLTISFPALKGSEEELNRAIRELDRRLCVETHKIGVLYVGKEQHEEVEILSNTHGSPRYSRVRRKLL